MFSRTLIFFSCSTLTLPPSLTLSHSLSFSMWLLLSLDAHFSVCCSLSFTLQLSLTLTYSFFTLTLSAPPSPSLVTPLATFFLSALSLSWLSLSMALYLSFYSSFASWSLSTPAPFLSMPCPSPSLCSSLSTPPLFAALLTPHLSPSLPLTTSSLPKAFSLPPNLPSPQPLYQQLPLCPLYFVSVCFFA